MILSLPSKYKNLLFSKNKMGKQVKLLQNYLNFYFIIFFATRKSMCYRYVWCLQETRRGSQIPWGWNYRELSPFTWVLGIECGSSGRADSALDLWAFSLAWKTMWISKDSIRLLSHESAKHSQAPRNKWLLSRKFIVHLENERCLSWKT